jgi:hypothetical protein
MEGVKEFADTHGLDDTSKSPVAWKKNMARLRGVTNVSREGLAMMEFVEVVNPDWRSVEVSA